MDNTAEEQVANVREFAKEQNIAEEKALAVGMAEKAKEFVKMGARFITGICLMGRRSIIKIVG